MIYKAGVYEILSLLIRGPKGFAEILGKVPRSTLASRLKELEKGGYIKRRVIDARPPKTEYEITESGRKVFEIIVRERGQTLIEDYFIVRPEEAMEIARRAYKRYGKGK